MTPIGRFSLKSETPTNPSVPTLFLALSGDATHNGKPRGSGGGGMTTSELSQTWIQHQIPTRHPRFHSRILDSKHFDLLPLPSTSINTTTTTTSSDNNNNIMNLMQYFMKETLHMSVYREDLKQRIEALLTHPLNVTQKLWEVQVSSGRLGSSGAIAKPDVLSIYREQMEKAKDSNNSGSSSGGGGNGTHGSTSWPSGQKIMESVLLFRFHHSIGDAVSLVSALGDLFDESLELKQRIQDEINRRKAKSQSISVWKKCLRWIQKLIWLLFGSMVALTRHGYLICTTRQNPFLQILNVTTAPPSQGRAISWCNVASVEEVKRVAKAIGPKVTLNDVFVSCVSKAIARQLQEHRERQVHPLQVHKNGCNQKENAPIESINVVIPAHLAGGILPPGREVGNMLGAFVARIPGEMNVHSNATDRLLQVHSSLDKGKKSPAPICGYVMARLSSQFLPERWAVRVFRKSNANAAVAVTNARGYPEKVHINGRRVESIQGFLPLPPGLPVGIVVGSYGNVVSLSINAEKWAVPDGDKFLGWIIEEYKLLCKEIAITNQRKERKQMG